MKGASAKANAGEMPPLKVVMVYDRPDYADCAASSESRLLLRLSFTVVVISRILPSLMIPET